MDSSEAARCRISDLGHFGAIGSIGRWLSRPNAFSIARVYWHMPVSVYNVALTANHNINVALNRKTRY